MAEPFGVSEQLHSTLLPCPFCGSAARIGGHSRRTGYYVLCMGDKDPMCDAQLGEHYGGYSNLDEDHMYGTPEEAAAKWNRRAPVAVAK